MTPLKTVQSVESLRERVSELRAKRGVALMDSLPVAGITAEIEEVSVRIEALEDLAAAESKRDYTNAAAELKDSRSVDRKHLEHFTDQAVIAVREAEIAMRTFVAAYRSMRALYHAASQVKHAVDGNIPTTWNLTELNSRMGFRVGALLATIDSRSQHRLGPVSWHLHGIHGADCSWVELETDILQRETK